ncbi:DNRLRE domain-containing protein [Streptomyces canus]|uniref:DNRLRE domain-containing protein n=1 Tax=Streptomyces canus TaxID=58343 RepID=UPI0033C390FA
MPISPSVKIVDTSSGLGISSSLGATTTQPFQVLGQGGIPASGVSAVSLNVVAVNPTSASSYMELWPDGSSRPSPGSVINFHSGQTLSNSVLVAPGSDGKVDVYNSSGTVGVVVDVSGYFTSSSSGAAPGGYVPVTQTRLVDTRDGTGATEAQLAPGGSISVQMDGVDGIADASSVFVNLTVPSPAAAGTLYAYAAGGSAGQPVLNYADATTASAATVAVGSAGQITVKNGSSTQSIDVIVDIYGYFSPGVTQGGGFTPVQARLLDTRTTTSIPAHGTVAVAAGGTDGLPVYGIGGVVLNLTTTDQQASGYLRAWPTGQPTPDTSVGNFQPGSSRADLAIVQPGTSGKINVYNGSSGTVDLIVDLEGWFSAIEPSIPTDLATAGTDTTTPMVSGVVYGPTGDSVTGEIFVQDTSGNPIGETPTAIGAVPSGERVTYMIPDGTLTAGQTYSWYMLACYASLCSAPSTTQNFTFTGSSSGSGTGSGTVPPNAITATIPATGITSEDAITDATGCGGSACAVNSATTTLKVGGDGTNHWASALKADFSAIPAGSTVYGATLSLTQQGCLGGCTSDTLDVEQADSDVTAQTTGAGLLTQEDPSGPVASGKEASASYDITSLVVSWLSSDFPNDGLVLQADDQSTATTGTVYYSSASTVPTADRPAISVTYTPPTAPSAPPNATVTPGDGGAVLTWSPPTDSGYLYAAGDDITYTVKALDPSGQVAQQATTGELHAVITGLTDGTAYTFAVSASNAAATGPSTTTVAATPQAVSGGTSQYVQTISQFLNAKDQLQESATASSSTVAAQDSSFASFSTELSYGADTDTAVAALEQANGEQDAQDATTLSSTLVVHPSGSSTTEVFTTADETFTTVDTSSGTSVSTPGESTDNDEFFFNASGTPFITGFVDAAAALDPVTEYTNQTATAPSAQESASDGTPEWALDSSGHAVLAPGYVDPGSGGSNGDPAVASWALSHYKISYNGFGDDCTDFVSRVLFYGGGFPKKYNAAGFRGKHPSTSDDRYWFIQDLLGRSWSHSWSVAKDLYQFEKKQYADFVSPHYVAPGDIVWVNWTGTSSAGISHAAVITKVSGSNIYVTQHSHTRINEPIWKVKDALSWQGANPHLHLWAAQPTEL